MRPSTLDNVRYVDHGWRPRPVGGLGRCERLAPLISPTLPSMATVIPVEDLRRSPTAALFEGRDEIPVSMFITEYGRGQGPPLHLHPYPEAFVVQTGTAVFTVGEDEVTVTRGHVVVIPAQTPHGFKGAGDDVLRVVSVHPSATVEQTNL
jgi:quercetin dioxygenase-like cupin family protein